MALSQNQSMQWLDLSYNAVSPAAAMVIASAFKTNNSLSYLNLNGNKIGKRGASALMGALRSGQEELRDVAISVEGCDSTFDDGTLFNPGMFTASSACSEYLRSYNFVAIP